MSSLDIVIVNWNAGELLARCLASVPKAIDATFELRRIIVVDNASTDGSADALSVPGVPIIVLRNAENRGFAAACNQGAAASDAEFVLFLNPDTELYERSLSAPLAYLAEPGHRDVGIVGVQLIDGTGRVARSCARFPTPKRFFAHITGIDRVLPGAGSAMRDWDHASTREVDQVIGAFFFVRRSVFSALAGFDERFFVYYEELDFSYRANLAGIRSVYLADVQAFHEGEGTTRNVKAFRLFLNLRSRMLYAQKHFSPVGAATTILGTVGIEPLTRAAHALLAGSGLRETAAGYAKIWRALPRLLVRPEGPAARSSA
jgi:hypothetical protein